LVIRDEIYVQGERRIWWCKGGSKSSRARGGQSLYPRGRTGFAQPLTLRQRAKRLVQMEVKFLTATEANDVTGEPRLNVSRHVNCQLGCIGGLVEWLGYIWYI
jgi:hypothetical protein